MRNFTFAVITYNHEKFIGIHLESIKFLIQKYGEEWRFSLIVLDDCSEDKTVEMVEKWVCKNKTFFESIRIIVNDENVGISGNYQNALKQIKTEYYKVAAGDDVYMDMNLFKLCKKNVLEATPLISFTEDTPFYKDDWQIKLLSFKKDKKKMAQRMMRYSQPIGAPGVFWNWDLSDPRLYTTLARFNYSEDSQLFEFLLFNKDVEFEVFDEPIMLYRTSTGISTNISDKKYERVRESYIEEEKRIKREIFVHSIPESVFNPYYIVFMMRLSLYKYLLKIVCPKIRRYDSLMKEKVKIAREHLVRINESYNKDLLE